MRTFIVDERPTIHFNCQFMENNTQNEESVFIDLQDTSEKINDPAEYNDITWKSINLKKTFLSILKNKISLLIVDNIIMMESI